MRVWRTMKTYSITYSITIAPEGTDKENAIANGWMELKNLLAVAPSIRDFVCHENDITEL
jgi:hypothetical protein